MDHHILVYSEPNIIRGFLLSSLITSNMRVIEYLSEFKMVDSKYFLFFYFLFLGT